ncbi:uncharacterized protein [Zea mays]|nr:uncharacterized protein LOC103633816 [Zea mays]|eukprot:XP_008653714.1 uncharacterized protein LOC103633816 [Zea mays]
MEQKPARGRIREAYQNPPAIETLGEIPKPHPNTSGFGLTPTHRPAPIVQPCEHPIVPPPPAPLLRTSSRRLLPPLLRTSRSRPPQTACVLSLPSSPSLSPCDDWVGYRRPTQGAENFADICAGEERPPDQALGRRAGRWMTMAGGGGLNRSSSRGQLLPQELLDDLCSRFLLNVPKEELESFERILFLLEQAHWFYEDNSVEHNPNLKSLSFKDFTSLMFKSCTALRPYIAHLDDIYKDFNNYKFRVPVSGAIILDDTYERCLLVKGWKAGASWSFPRGKRNKDEEDHTCAVREVNFCLYHQ